MPATAFEHRVNEIRGWCCLIVTAGSLVVVVREPFSVAFWLDGGYELISESSGLLGFALAAFFLVYLLVDTLVGIFCRHKFRRSMGAVFLHHAIVGIAVAAFLLPAPPIGFFFYVLGEALTACRLLPPETRFYARSGVFAFRRALWVYCGARDVWFYQTTAAKFGGLPALAPPSVATLLLVLDHVWWREHIRSGAQRVRKVGDARPPDVEMANGATHDGCGMMPDDESVVLLDPHTNHHAPSASCALAGCANHQHSCTPDKNGGRLVVGKAAHGSSLPSAQLHALDLSRARDEPEDCDTP